MDFHHLKRVILNFGLFSAKKHAVHNISLNILAHTFPIILSFMRQYVCVFPWCPSLLWASTSTVYFQDLGMTRARNFCLKSVTCLYNNPLTWVKRSVLCSGAWPFDKHFDMHLQNGSVFCIWSRASNLSPVRVLGIGIVSGATFGVVFVCVSELLDVESCLVSLLVWKAGPSVWVTVSMLIGTRVVGSCSTNLERQSAVVFLAPEIHSNVML